MICEKFDLATSQGIAANASGVNGNIVLVYR